MADEVIDPISADYSRLIHDHVADHWRGCYYEERFNFSGQDEINQIVSLREGEAEENANGMNTNSLPRGAEDRILIRKLGKIGT